MCDSIAEGGKRCEPSPDYRTTSLRASRAGVDTGTYRDTMPSAFSASPSGCGSVEDRLDAVLLLDVTGARLAARDASTRVREAVAVYAPMDRETKRELALAGGRPARAVVSRADWDDGDLPPEPPTITVDDLRARGWTPAQIRAFMPITRKRGSVVRFRYADVIAAEREPAMKRSLLRAHQTEDHMVPLRPGAVLTDATATSRDDLFRDGWTTRQIRMWLGAPEHWTGSSEPAWDSVRVAVAMAGPAFHRQRAVVAARQSMERQGVMARVRERWVEQDRYLAAMAVAA